MKATESSCDLEETGSWYENARKDFMTATSFDDAIGAVWGKDGVRPPKHDFYQHYTTLSRVVTKLMERRWWLTRSDSDSLNDIQESLKFGKWILSEKTYQASFVHGASESAALWGLYTPEDPFAIRITISGDAIDKWVCGMQDGVLSGDGRVRPRKIIYGDFKDIIYAAVAFRDKKRTRYDVKRRNGLYWSEVNCHCDISSLEDDVRCETCTGWIKDYEWRHERESRLCLRISRSNGSKAMWIPVTDALANNMKFTFSPWLPPERESEVERIITSALKEGFEKNGEKNGFERNPRRFRRSVLQGAMKLGFARKC